MGQHRIFIASILLTLSLNFTLRAQSNQGSISGVVADEQGAVIPSAKISAVNMATQVRSDTVTNGAGFYSLPNLQIGEYTVSAKMHGLFDTLHRIARANCTVLVGGETGTGKELAARAIHAESPRYTAPFATIAPPTPVPSVISRTWRYPRAAP